MTLIELLVAITMLALITTPFLNSFIVSVRNNYKARHVLRATTVGQNLMEGLKAFSVEDICRQINLDTEENTKLYLPGRYLEHQELENAAGEKSSVNGDEFIETASHKYVFGIRGIEEDGILYDARILLDASGYRGVPGQSYNDGYTLDIHKMSEETDVIYSLPKSKDAEIEGEEYIEGNGNLKRTFHVVVEAEEGKTKVEIAVTYGEDDNVTSLPVMTKTVTDLKNIYLMYYPNYKSVATNSYDCFVVDMKQDVNVNLHLIKQKYDHYAPSLVVREEAGLSDSTVPKVTLKTNVGKYLYDNTKADEKDALQCRYIKNGIEVASDDVGALLGFVDGGPQSLLGKLNKVDPLYKATVQIYPSGTYPDKFDDTQVLVQLEN